MKMEGTLDENKICFITCVNDPAEYEECRLYLSHLELPDGMEAEILEIREAASMAAGYMEGMQSSKARYKVYVHQDVRILHPRFIEYILQIFRSDAGIGMIGMVGCPCLPADGIMWHGERVGYSNNSIDRLKTYDVERDGLVQVEAVDGFLMATQYDLPWQTEIFDGWDFYDISQAAEFIKHGYQVVVPAQNGDWAVHEEKPVMSLWDYDPYRRRFLEKYKGIV